VPGTLPAEPSAVVRVKRTRSRNKEGVLWIENVTAAVNAVNCAGVRCGKKIPVKNRRRGKNNRPVC